MLRTRPARCALSSPKPGSCRHRSSTLQRLMRDASANAFDVVVFYDLDRFGRNAQKTLDALNQLADVGVEIYDYSTGQAVDLESFEGETLTFLKARFAQQ